MVIGMAIEERKSCVVLVVVMNFWRDVAASIILRGAIEGSRSVGEVGIGIYVVILALDVGSRALR